MAEQGQSGTCGAGAIQLLNRGLENRDPPRQNDAKGIWPFGVTIGAVNMRSRPKLLCIAAAVLSAGILGSAQNAPNSPALELLHVQGNVSMLAGAGGNI